MNALQAYAASKKYTDEHGGGGGGGTTNYNQLDNLPQIGGVTLKGNKSLSDLGIYTKQEIDAKIGLITDAQWTSIQSLLG